jgi:hypothetical protein
MEDDENYLVIHFVIDAANYYFEDCQVEKGDQVLGIS